MYSFVGAVEVECLLSNESNDRYQKLRPENAEQDLQSALKFRQSTIISFTHFESFCFRSERPTTEAMNAKHLLRFMKKKLKRASEDIIDALPLHLLHCGNGGFHKWGYPTMAGL